MTTQTKPENDYTLHDITCLTHNGLEREEVRSKLLCPICLHGHLKIAVEALEKVSQLVSHRVPHQIATDALAAIKSSGK